MGFQELWALWNSQALGPMTPVRSSMHWAFTNIEQASFLHKELPQTVPEVYGPVRWDLLSSGAGCVCAGLGTPLFSLPFPPPSHPLIHHKELCRIQNQNPQPERKFKSVNTFLFLRCSLFFSFHQKQLRLFSSPAPFMDCKCLEGDAIQLETPGSQTRFMPSNLQTISNLSSSLQLSKATP